MPDRLFRSAGVVALGTLFSRVLGLVRDMVLAALFTRTDTDAFFVAFRIPNALRQLFAEGAVSGAVVPVLAAKLEREGETAARNFYARMRTVSVGTLVCVSLLGVFLAESLAGLFAEGARERPSDFQTIVVHTRIVFPYIFFMGVSALGMAALNAKRRFAVAAFAPALLNVAFIAGALFLPAVLRTRGLPPGLALPVSALIGGLLQVVAQWPALAREGFGGAWRSPFGDPDVREVFRRLFPLTFGMGVYYVDVLLSSRFLSGLGPGAQSYFSWAMRICDFPQGTLVMALSTAALPELSGLFAQGKREEALATFRRGLGLALFIAIPCTTALCFLSAPIVSLLFERGAFDGVAVRETARALVYQGFGLVAVASVRQAVSVFYAMGDTRSPVWVSAIDLLVFVVSAWVLRGPLGHAGVSAAVSLSSLAQVALLLGVLRARVGKLGLREVGLRASKVLLASLASVLFASAALRLSPNGAVGNAASLGVFCLAFCAGSVLLGIQEFRDLGGAVKRKLQGGRR